MKWRKLGLIYQPTIQPPWFTTSAIVPTPISVSKESVTFLITRCDADGIGRPAQLIMTRDHSGRITFEETPEPLLEIGRPGMFDDNGLIACSMITSPTGQQIMYYAGFELCTKVRYRLLTGAAVRDGQNGRFQRVQETPVLDRRPGEAFFRGGPFVLQDGNRYRMWYVGGDRWLEIAGRSRPVYEIRYFDSSNPLHWNDESVVCLELGDDDHAFGRPWIVRSDARYQMYFSRRSLSLGGAYRMGYAESDDGIRWERMDAKLNLNVSVSGWDSEAIMYAAVIEFQNQIWCFYNGNEFGREGFGAAVLEES